LPLSEIPVPGEFAPRAKQAVYDAIALRRDIRSFRPDPVPDETLLRILGAAHRAGSVGFMQPWDFVVVRSPERRARIYDLFRRANDRAARHWRGDRAEKYLALKLQGVLDAPLGICVTCDTRRGGPHVLGRDSIRETDVYSTCLAVQNLWLAARAEGVGVGWVSIVDNDELAAELALPDGVIPVAFLCVGYPVEFPATPMLEATGWRDREELARLVHFDGWGGAGEDDPLRALLGSAPDAPEAVEEDAPATVAALAASVPPVAAELEGRVRARLDALSKPRGSLGRIEELAVRLATMQAREFPVAERRAALVFAGDHGVCEEGVSAYRPGVTARLCYNMVAGGGVVNALARRQGVDVRVVDVGVDHDFGAATGLVHAKVARGTRSLARHDAMTRAQAEQALLGGMDAVRLLGPCDVLALGEVGIGNTTSAAALFALLTGASPEDAVGRGTGVGDATLARKADAVRRAAERTRDVELDTLGKLSAAGGYEIAALAGAILGAAARRIPLVLDGFITGVAALAAVELAPAARGYLVASHLSAERAHAAVLESLGLAPLLQLGLRLGEGSGALLALPLVESACALLRDVRTFREAGIEEPIDPRGLG
jgi:nicotinate-nucleotide--dimethylbenzimidazole phosphoribosyltransferase